MKKQVLKRIPPGDRWAETSDVGVSEHVFPEIIVGDTLTKALGFIYKKYDIRLFEVDAKAGIVSIDDGKKAIEEIEVDSLYDE